MTYTSQLTNDGGAGEQTQGIQAERKRQPGRTHNREDVMKTAGILLVHEEGSNCEHSGVRARSDPSKKHVSRLSDTVCGFEGGHDDVRDGDARAAAHKRAG